MAVVTAEIRFAPKNAAWFTTNAALVLADGEIVYRSTDGKYIIGDGTTAVSGLTFYGGVSTAPAWGSITGTLTNQTDLTTYLSTNYQPLATNLTSLAGLTYVSGSFVKMTAAGTFALDTNTYLTSAAIGVTIQGYSANTTLLGNTTTGSGSTLALSISPTFGTSIITPSISLSGSISSASWTTSGINIKETARTFTNTTSSGTVANTYTNVWGGNNIVSSSATTYTNYYANYFKAEVQSTGSTITNNYAAGFSGNAIIERNSNSLSAYYVSNTSAGASAYSGVSFITDGVSAGASFIGCTSSGNTYIGASRSVWYSQKQITFWTDANVPIDFAINGSVRLTLATAGALTFADTFNMAFSGTTGTKIGTATTQKLSFWNATPIVQPTTAVTSATIVGGAGTTVKEDHTFDGYTIAQVVKALRNTGLLA